MEPVPDFAINLPRVDIVCPAEGIACVQKVASVGNVDGIGGNGPALSELFADGQIESGVRRQVRRAVPIEEARTELVCRGRPHVARQGQREHGGDSVTLIVIEEKIAGRRVF